VWVALGVELALLGPLVVVTASLGMFWPAGVIGF
jgi:hypothetical protein